jgi:hypothetical protein
MAELYTRYEEFLRAFVGRIDDPGPPPPVDLPFALDQATRTSGWDTRASSSSRTRRWSWARACTQGRWGGRAGGAGGVLHAHAALLVVFFDRITTIIVFIFINVYTNTNINTGMGYGRCAARPRTGRSSSAEWSAAGACGRRDACGRGGGDRWGTGERGGGGQAEPAARVVDDGHIAGAGAVAVAVGEDCSGGNC